MAKTLEKTFFYPLAAGVGAATAAALTALWLHYNLFYVLCYVLFGALVGLTIARIFYHSAVLKDNSPKTWQCNVYAVVVCLGWYFAIWVWSWDLVSAALCAASCAGILFIGTRYLTDVNDDGIPDIFQKPEVWQTKDWMKANIRFAFVDDQIGGKADKERPLCKVGEEFLTVNEALDRGLADVAQVGVSYIEGLFNKESNE